MNSLRQFRMITKVFRRSFIESSEAVYGQGEGPKLPLTNWVFRDTEEYGMMPFNRKHMFKRRFSTTYFAQVYLRN